MRLFSPWLVIFLVRRFISAKINDNINNKCNYFSRSVFYKISFLCSQFCNLFASCIQRVYNLHKPYFTTTEDLTTNATLFSNNYTMKTKVPHC